MVRQSVFAAGAVLVALVLAACGGAPAGQGASPAPDGTQGPGASADSQGGPGQTGGSLTGADPCGLLEPDEVWALLNSEPLLELPDPNLPTRCNYSDDDTVGSPIAFQVDYYSTNGSAQLDTFDDNPSYEAIEGIGDRAVIHGTELAFLLGDQLIQLHASWRTNEKDRASVLLAARIIIARLTTGTVPPGLIPTTPPVVTATKACDVLSADEAASVIGLGPLSATSNESTPTFCYFATATGDPVASIYFDRKDGLDDWPSLVAGLMEAERVAGLGDDAVFEPGSYTLYALQGDTILNASLQLYDLSPEEVLAKDRALLEIMLAHL